MIISDNHMHRETNDFWYAMTLAKAQTASVLRAFVDLEKSSVYKNLSMNDAHGLAALTIYLARPALVMALAFNAIMLLRERWKAGVR